MKIDKDGILTAALAMCIVAGTSGTSLAGLSPEQAALRNVESITVHAGCCEQARKAGLNEEDIRGSIQKQIEDAGIEVMPRQVWATLPGRCRFNATVTIYKPTDLETLVYSLKVDFVQTVTLERQPETKVDAITWQRTWFAHGTRKRLAEAVPHNLKVLTASFIRDYRQANPKENRSSGAGDTNNFSPASPGQTKSAPGSVSGRHGYIGSRSSDVFHKPDCHLAKNISPENLVSYRTRDDAIKAAKRPCKSCKP
ncbi:MAG: Ada metal-binding domain-containing protein [Planctomycetota bacterium]|nr:Ada metal-binding domain-containing protein [Planctomycetota bacterium]